MFSDPVVSDYTAGIAVHWYFDKQTPPWVLDETHEALPDKFLLYTEACRGTLGMTTKLLRNNRYFHNEVMCNLTVSNCELH